MAHPQLPSCRDARVSARERPPAPARPTRRGVSCVGLAVPNNNISFLSRHCQSRNGCVTRHRAQSCAIALSPVKEGRKEGYTYLLTYLPPVISVPRLAGFSLIT